MAGPVHPGARRRRVGKLLRHPPLLSHAASVAAESGGWRKSLPTLRRTSRLRRMDQRFAAMQHASGKRRPGMQRSLPRPIAPLFTLLLLANVAAWGWAWAAFGDRPVLLGTALLAWVFGLRHAVDADHIAAIDNVVRRQMQAGGRPMTIGLWFSLGHATVVVLASLALALTAAALQDRLADAQAMGGVF